MREYLNDALFIKSGDNISETRNIKCISKKYFSDDRNWTSDLVWCDGKMDFI